MVTSTTLINLLREVYESGNMEMEVRSYSGRGMYGDTCVGVVLGDYAMSTTVMQTSSACLSPAQTAWALAPSSIGRASSGPLV